MAECLASRPSCCAITPPVWPTVPLAVPCEGRSGLARMPVWNADRLADRAQRKEDPDDWRRELHRQRARAAARRRERDRGARQPAPVSYTHLRAHETPEHLVCRLL